MLRLLPDRLYAGLLGEGPWLAHGSKGRPLPTAALPAFPPLSDMLAALLHADSPRRRARKLSVMLPGHAARCVSLPWSPHLRSDEEKQAYALAHLEQAGLVPSDRYVVHAEFRHYGACGFAYAVSRELIEQLHAVATRHALDLTTVLPIGAIAHLAAQPARGAGLELSLIIEEAAMSALVFCRAGFRSYDAESVIGGKQAALRRLMTRLTASAGEFKGIAICATNEDAALAEIAGSFAAGAAVNLVRPHEWRRYL